jgi:hypothetical protein
MAKDRARERAAQMRADQERRDKRRRAVLFGGVAAATIAVVAGLTWLGLRGQSGEASASSSIEGLKTYSDLSRDHTEKPVTYAQTPPVGGAHSTLWQNCGWYDATIKNENAVHSMEHAAAWITYSPDLAADQKAKLKSELAGRTYVVASQYPGLPAPVVASAWGAQVQLTGVGDPRLAQFLTTYANSPKAPEPGGECTGGTGTPT